MTITLTDRLFGLLEEKLPNLGRRIERTISRELGGIARRESNVEIVVSTPNGSSLNPESKDPVFKPTPEFFEAGTVSAKAQDVEQGAETETSESAPTAPKPFAEAPVEQPKDLPTEEDVRACIHRTRQRFEGEDYKNNTSSEVYLKYHKVLNAEFKRISAILGAEKPSKLPAEQRAAFIAECDALIIGEDGNITLPPAPF